MVFGNSINMGANPGEMGGCILPNNLTAYPPIYFMEVENFPYEPILSSQYQKMINFAKSSPQYPKMVNFAKPLPQCSTYIIHLYPCQSSVILVTFFQILFYRPQNLVYSNAYRVDCDILDSLSGPTFHEKQNTRKIIFKILILRVWVLQRFCESLDAGYGYKYKNLDWSFLHLYPSVTRKRRRRYV